MNEKITFSFGKNWQNYSKLIDQKLISFSQQDIEEWVEKTNMKNQRIIDIGCGSGIHSLVFYQEGARELLSFDYDIYSVETTKKLSTQVGNPKNWKIVQGSILDKQFIKDLGKFNLVYSWGVLHHTGALWQAIENALLLVETNGYFFVSIYTKGDNYPNHLALKQRYNQASPLGKKFLEYRYILGMMKGLLRHRKNPFNWNQTKERGMNVYYDILDWLGGLPYEVASPTEVIEFCQKFGFKLIKMKELSEGGCSQYLFQRKLD